MTNIDVGHPTGMMIAQEDAQLIHHLRDWAIRIAIDAIEGRPRMGIEKSQSEPPGRHWHCHAR
jgi:hypothetical protein